MNRFLFANQYYRHRLGVDPENLQGRHWSELLNHPNQEVALAVKKAYQQKKPVHFEGEIHYFQGSTREVSAHYIPHLDQQQNVQGLYALIDDQTLSRRAELALKESEKRWRDLVQGSIQGIYIHQHWTLVFANQAVADIFGYENPDEVLALGSVEALLPPHERERLRGMNQARDRGEPVPIQYEYDGLRKDGSIVNLINLIRLVEWQGELSTQTTIIDITELKQAENALRNSESRFRNLVEGSIQGIYVHRDYKPFFVNQAFVEMMGYDSAKELYALESMDVLFAPKERERLRGYRSARLRGENAPSQYQVEAVRKGGSTIILELSVRLVEWNGETAIQNTVVDVTERMQAQSELKKSEQMARQLSQQVMEAQEQERKRVAAELHDGINPALLNTQVGIERAISQYSNDPEHAKALLETELLPGIQQNINEVQRIQMNLRPGVLDDFGLVTALEWLCAEAEQHHDSTLITAIQLENREVPEDLKVPIFRIAQEALNNIARHSHASVATVSLEGDQQIIRLTIGDDGQGIEADRSLQPKDQQEERAHYGLIIMQERASFSGGHFNLKSSAGAGTEIMVTWPRSMTSQTRQDHAQSHSVPVRVNSLV